VFCNEVCGIVILECKELNLSSCGGGSQIDESESMWNILL